LATQAVTKHKEGKLEDAIAFYLEVIELDENQPAWVYANVIILLAQNDFVNQAKELVKKAFEKHHESDDIYRAIEIVFRSENDLLTSVPNYLGEALAAKEEWEQAIAVTLNIKLW
jgi:O-antigen biosynthesis protein